MHFVRFTISGVIAILRQVHVTILWGFLDTLTKFISMIRVWMGMIVDKYIFKINILKIDPFSKPSAYITVKVQKRLGANGVPVARYGLIFKHTEATGSRKVSRYLPDLREVIKKYKK